MFKQTQEMSNKLNLFARLNTFGLRFIVHKKLQLNVDKFIHVYKRKDPKHYRCVIRSLIFKFRKL